MALVAAGAIASGIGTGLSIFGKLKESKAKEQLLKYQSRENERSSLLTIERGMIDEARLIQARRSERGQITSQFAANGVRVDSGSAFASLLAQASLDEAEVETKRFNVGEQARSLIVAAQTGRSQAKNVVKAARVAAVGQGIGETAQLAGSLT